MFRPEPLRIPEALPVPSQNPVYIQGDYNSNSTDNFWPSGVQTGVADKTGPSSAAIIADAVTLLSNNWIIMYSRRWETLRYHATTLQPRLMPSE